MRLAATPADNGTSEHVFGHGAMAAGGTLGDQFYFRNSPPVFCTPDAFNLSNGRVPSW